MTKIRFSLDPNDWHRSESETLWATHLASSSLPNAFQLENTPFHAKGISYHDVVSAVERAGVFEFAGTLVPSGHSTYRLLVDYPLDTFQTWWDKLQRLGCTYESGDFQGKKLFAVDIPSTADIYAVYRILEEGERRNIWNFEEGHVGHDLRNSPPKGPLGHA